MNKTRIIRKLRMVRVLLLWIALFAGTTVHAQSCRQALVLALDVSGSVNAQEYRQQVDGLATALDDPDVRDLILIGADAPVMLAIYEWSSRNHQYVIQPWVRIENAATLDDVIARLQAHQPVRAGLKNALGTSLSFAAGLLSQQDHCWQLTIDVSGDGPNNIGSTPQQVYELGGFDRISVNALVIGDVIGSAVSGGGRESEELRQYFEDFVIRGPQAFALVANGYGDYAGAMRAKLIRELTIPMLGQLDPNLRP